MAASLVFDFSKIEARWRGEGNQELGIRGKGARCKVGDMVDG